MSVLIYALVDRSGHIRWIGKTERIQKRYASHLKERPWVKAMRIIEYADDSNWQERERYWIAYGRKHGWPLENQADGGESCAGFKMTAEANAKISKALKGRRLSEEHRAALSRAWDVRRINGFSNNPESTRIKLSLAHKGIPLTTEHRKNISRSRLLKGIKHSSEAKERMRQRALSISDETRQKMSLSHRGKTLSDENKAKLRAANLGHHRGGWKLSMVTRERIAQATKLRWQQAKKEGKSCLTSQQLT